MRQEQIVGKGLVRGRAEGEAVVSSVPLCFRTEYDPATGQVIGLRHPLQPSPLETDGGRGFVGLGMVADVQVDSTGAW